jgi:Domain of unknown function (DUF4270)
VNRNKFGAGLTALLILFSFLYSCTKIKGTDIGSDLLPIVDNITTFDTTLEVETENFIFTDSAYPRLARNINGSSPEMLAGYISNDPQFGQTNAAIYMLLEPQYFPFPFDVKDSLYLDSVVLGMAWTGTTIGDTNLLQKFNVYQVDSTINPDSAYKTNVTFPYSTFLGTKTFAPKILDDSLYLFRQSVKNQLRIRLDDAFGNLLLSKDTFFKGFAIVPDLGGASSANALMGFNISDTNTYLRLYYRYDTAGKQDTTYRSFKYNLTTGFADNITRNYAGSEINTAVAPGADSLIYLQTSPGSYGIIRMPSLDGFKAAKGNVVIHRAEISMQQIASIGQGDDIFNSPKNLYIDFRDTVNNIQFPFLRDGFSLNTYSANLLGGTRKYVPGPGNLIVSEYKFNIPSYIQGIITRNNNNYPIYLYSPYVILYNHLFISSFLNPIANGRVKVGGGSNKQHKMVMRIIYSKI